MADKQPIDERTSLELALQQLEDVRDMISSLQLSIANGRISFEDDALPELREMRLENERARQEIRERLVALGWSPPEAREPPEVKQ